MIFSGKFPFLQYQKQIYEDWFVRKKLPKFGPDFDKDIVAVITEGAKINILRGEKDQAYSHYLSSSFFFRLTVSGEVCKNF